MESSGLNSAYCRHTARFIRSVSHFLVASALQGGTRSGLFCRLISAYLISTHLAQLHAGTTCPRHNHLLLSRAPAKHTRVDDVCVANTKDGPRRRLEFRCRPRCQQTWRWIIDNYYILTRSAVQKNTPTDCVRL